MEGATLGSLMMPGNTKKGARELHSIEGVPPYKEKITK
jgi:hypothetical protein